MGRVCDPQFGLHSLGLWQTCIPAASHPRPLHFLRTNPPPITGLLHDGALFKGVAREKLTLCRRGDSSHSRLLRASPRGQYSQLLGHTLLPGFYQPVEKGKVFPLGTKMGRHPARVLRPAET